MWVRAGRFTGRFSRLFVIISVVCFLIFVVSTGRTFAATTYHVKVGGEVMGLPLARGGMAWFNGYDPAVIVIHPGDTVTWDLLGGVHTVTSTATLSNPMEPHTITGFNSTGVMQWDSSPNFNPPGPPPVMGTPGVDSFSVVFNNAGTFTYFCKVHAYYIGQSWVGMSGTVLVVPLTAADAVGSLSAISYASLALAIVALVVAIYTVVRRKPEIQKTG